MNRSHTKAQEIIESDFWQPRPKLWGWRTWSLLLPSIASAIGFFAFAVLAYSFTELTTLPPDFRKSLVLIGAFSLATGGEIGTLGTVVEIFRRRADDKQAGQSWGWLGLTISIISTLAAFLLAFATLLGESTTWATPVRMWGAIGVGLFAALDSYTNFAEFGRFLSSFDRRMRQWEKKYYEWRRWMAQSTGWAEMPTLKPVRPSASEEDTQEFYITRPDTPERPATELDALLAEGKTPETIAMALGKPLPIVRRLIAGKGG